ncbi:hypothetical protein APUTEX25_005738 [Auxenochlorella protothecoides]|uniref:Major facilitator superfamily (MFS) profile domain-containing protein n=1 Tax=Auxenochlorella protothecoides TaxID=3075 RepID=A0A3M7KZD0_AUXPR|nr:hypothetical protein APUTEX25_005738 [Auxenochlorella protothecoides]|eukprot:RMZ55697.1 hypothetical protein APUTEX25_005738 [Auxenochlorella protothecoides]
MGPAPPRASSASGAGSLGAAGAPQPEKKTGFLSMFSPFTDPEANKRLIALCTAQMLCSVATLIHDTYLPVYLSEVLHLSNSKVQHMTCREGCVRGHGGSTPVSPLPPPPFPLPQIGNLQAVAQFLSKASGSVSGTAADLLTPARMVIFGTLLTTINKPMFAASGAVYAGFGASACLYWITFGKIFDRVSKGIREAPSKALIGELAAASGDSPAAAFSLRQSMATFGALVGAASAAAAYKLSGQNYVATFALAALPATLALVLVSAAFRGVVVGPARDAAGPRADATAAASAGDGPRLGLVGKARALLGAFQPAYWQALAVVGILYFARFDASFVTLRAKTVMDRASLPALTSIMMVTQAALATPAGLRAKRSVAARNAVVVLGIFALIGANAAFALLPSTPGMMLGALLIGVHMAMTHGVTIGMLSTYIPSATIPGLGKVAGTAWSFTDMLLGVVLAYSNSLAGRLADISTQRGMGNVGCFYGGATACVLAIAALLLFSTFGSLGREDLVPSKPKRA